MMRWVRVMAMLVCLLILAACGEVPQAQVGDEPENGVQTVKIYASAFDSGLDEVIRAYYAIYPNVRVEKVTASREEQMQSPLDDRVHAQIAERAVDIVPVTWTLLDEKLLTPLEPYIHKYGFDLTPLDQLLPALKWDGKLYELPYRVYMETLLYNPDYFAQHHVEIPKEPMSWDQFRELAARLAGGGGYGFHDEFPEFLVQEYVAQRHGTNPGPQTVAEVTEALQFFSTMVFTDKSIPKAVQYDWTKNGQGRYFSGRDYFNLGQAGMVRGFLPYPTNYYRVKIGMLPAPQIQTGPGGIRVSPESFGIAANSRRPDAAFQFLAFLAGPQGQAVLARAGSVPAYRTPDVKQAYLSQEEAPPTGVAAMLDATWMVDPRPATKPPDPNAAEKSDPRANLNIPANEVLSGQKSVADAVRDWASAAKAK